MNVYRMTPSSVFLLASVLWSWVASPVLAAVPDRINFQGKLLDTNNVPRNGSYGMTFRVWDAPSGGTEIWTETQGSVSVTNGVFSVQLGASSPLSASVFDSATRYLEVEIGGETASTRQRFATSPYAFRANVADDLVAGDTNYIQNTATLQSGSTFYVSSGTIDGQLRVGGTIIAGSGNHLITTSAGQLNDQKLIGGATHYIQNTATLQSGATFYVSSATVAGPLYVSGGTRVGGMIDTNSATVSVGATTTETSVYSFTVPAGLLETNRTLRVHIIATFLNNTGNNTRTYRLRAKLGATTVLDKTTASVSSNATAIDLSGLIILTNAGSSSSQVAGMHFLGERAGTVIGTIVDTGTSSVDTSSDQTFDVTVTNSFSSASQVFTKLAAYAVIE